MNKKQIEDICIQYEPQSMQTYLPIVWKKAKDDYIIDSDGKKYIDFTSTIFVSNVGHANKRVKKYIKRQLNQNLLHSYIYKTDIRAKFISKLMSMMPSYLEKCFLLSSGTEATETAIKLMRAYTGRKKIISFKGAMHGRTMGAELMKGSNVYSHKDFLHLDFPTDQSIFMQDINNFGVEPSEIAGFMIETYQGWSARFLPYSYVSHLVEYARTWDIPVCFDEIQAGFGRTGKMFGYMYYNIAPDLVCIGKGIGGGLPLSGVLGRKNIIDVLNPGEMSSTHSANPLVCASGLAVLEEIEQKNLIEYARIKGDFLHKSLTLFHTLHRKIIDEINFLGMVGSIIFKTISLADRFVKICAQHGLLVVHTGKESVKFGPPLTLSKKNMILFYDIVIQVLNILDGDCEN
jgi:4-aminobutyrate aminotransferase-like enzyme